MVQWRQRWNQVSEPKIQSSNPIRSEYRVRCRLLRPEVLLASVLWEETEAINQAKQLLHNFLTNGSVIPANLREVMLQNALLTEKSIWKHKINFHLGCLHRRRTLRRIHVLAILLGSIYLVARLTGRNNRTTAAITSIGKNQRRLVIVKQNRSKILNHFTPQNSFTGCKIVCYLTSLLCHQMKWYKYCKLSQVPQLVVQWLVDFCKPNGMIYNRKWERAVWISPKSYRQSHNMEPQSSTTMR